MLEPYPCYAGTPLAKGRPRTKAVLAQKCPIFKGTRSAATGGVLEMLRSDKGLKIVSKFKGLRVSKFKGFKVICVVLYLPNPPCLPAGRLKEGLSPLQGI